jgi:hypothetical protein
MAKDTVSVEIKGLKELEAKLKELSSTSLANEIGKDASLAMGLLLQEAERKGAPEYDGDNPGVPAGFLKKNIICSKPKIKKNTAVVVVGPNPFVDYPDYAGKYTKKRVKGKNGKWKWKKVGRISVAAVAWFIERGFKHKISGKHIPARPFIVPALIATVDECVDACVKSVRERLRPFGLKR